MKKLLTLALAGSMVVAACGGTAGGGDVAATVGDTELTVSDVQSVPFEAAGTMEDLQFAQYLTALIQWQVLDDAAAEEFSVDPTPEEVDAKLESLLAEQAGGMTAAELAESQNFSEETLRRIARVQLIQEKVVGEMSADVPEPTDEEVADAIRDEELGLTEVCARHVLVETAEEASEAKQRLEGGEDFATVAEEMSIDPSAAENGGDLGCQLAQQYVDEFRDAAATAEIDAITDPVESQFGFHVLQVYDRTDPAPEDLPTEDEIRQSLAETAGSGELQEWLLAHIREAEVTVEEEYGSWVLEPQPMVQPPTS
ncbi:MAG TPA: peptidylprolyl isomerase [Acidimicrobiia bacterium]|nr:peptidylprolyl isomerase [Acidimicrobiia bacterium]